MSTTSPTAALSEKDIASIRSTIEPWTRACLEADWDTLLEMCTDDIVFMPPGEPAVQGPAVRSWLEEFPPIREMAWDIDHAEGKGDLAVLRGWVEQTLVESGEEVQIRGKYTDLLRREPDGTWRYALVIWNPDHPL